MRLFCDPSRLSHADGARNLKENKKGTRPLKEQEAVISLCSGATRDGRGRPRVNSSPQIIIFSLYVL